jgi:hypothetical protein
MFSLSTRIQHAENDRVATLMNGNNLGNSGKYFRQTMDHGHQLSDVSIDVS